MRPARRFLEVPPSPMMRFEVVANSEHVFCFVDFCALGCEISEQLGHAH